MTAADGDPIGKIDPKDERLIGPIAAFIGARLQHTKPVANVTAQSLSNRVSTIRVDQYKEKFWFVRVYCVLADTSLVMDAWRERALVGSPDQSFCDERLRLDALHYRRCYMDAVSLVPHLRHRICSQADYTELLYDNVDDFFKLAEGEKSYDMLAHYRARYKSSSNDDLRRLLSRFYAAPTSRDIIQMG